MRTGPFVGKKNAGPGSLLGLYTVVLTAGVVAALYFGRGVLVPLALAGLLTFVLTPLVTRLERFIGRVAAVSGVAVLVFILMGAISWVLTRQTLDLITQLPAYRANIERKIKALELSKDGPLKRFSTMVVEIENQIPLFASPSPPSAPETAASKLRRADAPRVVEVGVAPVANPWARLQVLIGPFLSVLASSVIVIVLVIFMLLKREDVRGRLIKLTGHGRISSTSRVMEDAAARVSRYLITQLVVNTVFGFTVAGGLYLIGIPNAFLWGALAAVLRFVPYIGALLAAFCPVVLALAVSPGWEMVFLTIALFAVLDLVTGYFLEPLLYRSSTGVSSLGLIVAAIFWTWLWGPIGLLLSTPLTVCLAVLGKHVPRLAFFSILLGSEEALSPAEECYHRLLVEDLSEAGKVVDAYAAANSLTALYDRVIIPTVTMAEVDFQREEVDETQRNRVLHGVKDIINDLSSRPVSASQLEADKAVALAEPVVSPKSDCRVFCISPRGERDELAGAMLVHLLRQQGFEATTSAPNVPFAQLSSAIAEFNADAVCLSVIPPTTLIHARHLCAQLRANHRDLRIVVGIWGATENLEEAIKGLRSAGADEVVISLAEAVVQFAKFSTSLLERHVPAHLGADEEKRIAAVLGLKAYGDGANPVFDKLTKTIARTFNVPIALVTLIDRDRQHFKSAFGLPEELAQICDIPRADAVCNHVVLDNSSLVVEDLTRDRRFAKNSLLRKFNLRFYAGIPLHAPNGQPVGALCILDTKSRQFSAADQRLFNILGDEVRDALLAQAPHEPLPESTEALSAA